MTPPSPEGASRVDRRYEPAGPVRGSVQAPPDKSISHRVALLGALGDGTTRASRYLDSADTRSSLSAIGALGASVEIGPSEAEAIEVEIGGFGVNGATPPGEPIDVGNAGTLIRLITGLLAPQDGREFTLDGDASIRRRPMGRVSAPLAQMGAQVRGVESDGDVVPPLTITGRRLRGIEYEMPVASAQVKSCLLLAALSAEGASVVHEAAETRDHTERMLAAAGVEVRVARKRGTLPVDPVARTVTLRPTERLRLPPLTVPGDLSSAAFHIAAALIVPGSDVTVTGVGLNPTRIGLLGVLNRMGASIEVSETGHQGGEPVGSVRARYSGGGDGLQATDVLAAEVPLAIDELPLVGLLGCFASGTTRVKGAAELRFKESDRIAGVVAALRGIGAEAEERPDGFVIEGGKGLAGGEIDSLGDHRLAMLGAVAGLVASDGVVVRDFAAAAVSYPGFERDLDSLRG